MRVSGVDPLTRTTTSHLSGAEPGRSPRYVCAMTTPYEEFGGSDFFGELVADFLGRPYNTKAFEDWLNR